MSFPTPTTDPAVLPCLCAQTRRVDRLLNRIYDDALRPLGITTMQKSLLTNIGRQPGGIDFADLSTLLAMDRSTLTRNLATLESAGFIAVAAGDPDRRKRLVTLTVLGKQTVADSDPLWNSAQQRMIDALGFDRAAELVSVLASVERTVRELDR